MLRTAMAGWLPEEVLWRKKSPYPKTWDPRYLSMVIKELKHLLNSPDRPLFQLVNIDTVKTLLTEEHLWPWYGQLMRLPQTIAYLLQIDFWMQQYDVKVV